MSSQNTQVNYPAHMKPFKIYIKKVQRLVRCEKMKDNENRGLCGFHNFSNCPDCIKENKGFELWGENNHMQAQLNKLYDRAEMVRNFTKTYTYPVFIDTEETLTYIKS